MKLLIFGATGLTGRELVKQALGRGDAVTAFVRTPAKLSLEHDHLTVVQGDVTDPASVERAVAGHDAVLCALGASGIFSRTPAITRGVRNIVRGMEGLGVERFVYESALGVGDSRADASFFVRHIVIPFILRHPYADHEEDERTIKASTLAWTIVRPTNLTNGARRGHYQTGAHLKDPFPFGTISRADVAHFMLEQTRADTNVRQALNVRY